jgi:transposase InsO family protein
MRGLSEKNPRYGYRRVWALLRREGWYINKKRVHRLWKEAGLRVPAKQRKRKRLSGQGENGCTRRQAEYKNHVWSYDFVMDQSADGRRLKMLAVVEEYTRECLSTVVERSITAEDVVKTLAALFARRGEPEFIRSDNAVPSSSPRPSSGGWMSLESRPFTSSRALRGRMPTQRRSTAALETSY